MGMGSGTTRAAVSDARAALERPDAHLERLYDMAARDQWTIAGLDWSAVELDLLPEPLRRVAADLFAQVHHGELTAMSTAARMMDRLERPSARLVCATQVADEARHARFFENLLSRLGHPGEVRPSVRALMREVDAQETPEGAMLGMQIVIEGVAHSLFSAGARLFAELGDQGALPPAVRAAKIVVGEWLPMLLGRDESRHIAFGIAYLRERIPALDRARRDAMEVSVHRWGALVLEAARDPDLLDGVGVDGRALSARCIEDLNLRLAQVGLEARLPPP